MYIKNGYPGAGSINILLMRLELLYSINSIVFLKQKSLLLFGETV